jgi:uncharacterized SAM-binding protein YcdF (DUF218 family)/glycosyltransferase involved in cell wall biosynthesis
MLRGHDIICISSIDWDFIWQIHQQTMATLAEQGNRVLFVENTGVRMPRLRDLPRLRHRVRNWWRGTKGFRQERENLFVYSPLFVPFPYSRVARWINRALLFRALRRWMVAADFHRPIVWTFLPSPLALDLIGEVQPSLVVYYCADDFAASSPGARRIARSEERLFREADLVFVTSETLRARAARHTDRVHLVPAGVNFEAFERVRNGMDQVPPDLAALPRPIVGYVGGLHQWVDQDLLVALSDRLPDATFALVGPVQTDVSRLDARPNVHLLGAREHTDVPRYIKGFDVGIVPYGVSAYTANVYPVKVNEYLAMATPVVSTDLPELRRFNAEHGDIVRIGTDPERFAAEIRQVLAPAPASDVARRIEVARENSSSNRLETMTRLIEAALRARQVAPVRWEERLRRIYRRARRRAAQVVLTAALLYTVVFYTPLLWWAAEPLRVSTPPRHADAIVVFAGGVGESGRAGGGYQERVKQAVDLYRAGYAPRLVFSSGYVFTFQEAEVMKALAVANGVPADAIVLEKRAANTYENVRFVRDILVARAWDEVLLVSSPYHMRRATATWRRQAPGVTVVPTPVPQSQFYAHGRGATFDQVRGIVHEYVALAAYWWREWL